MLLYEDKAYYDDVVEIYKNDIDEKTNNTIQVILNKAINALRVFGIKINKQKNKYHIDSNLYSLDYDLNDLKSISLLIDASENFPDIKTKSNLTEFLNELNLRMDASSKNALSTITTNYDFSFFYKNVKSQIETCKELCTNEMAFDITYLHKGKEISASGFAQDVTFDTKNAYLQMYNKDTNLKTEIPLANILRLVPQPAKSKIQGTSTTITFKVKGRLAKTYKLKDNETLINIDENGNRIIANRDEDLDKFFSRIMRYSDCCKIISPKTIKEKFIELINETIAQYDI